MEKMKKINDSYMEAHISDIGGKTDIQVHFVLDTPKPEMVANLKQIVDTVALMAGCYNSV